MDTFTVKIKPLTPLWTGDANRKYTVLRETGILGSLRWWYEAVVRGLGGTACDPTNTKCDGEKHCDVCELFGCTGWGRKFRLEVEELNDKNVVLRFVKLRNIEDVELALLSKTIEIIGTYGAIGGKIAESKHGLIRIVQNDLNRFSSDRIQIKNYLKTKGDNIDNPNISRFVFINKDLEYAMVKKLKDKLLFLKGQKGKGKRYFYKTYNNKAYSFFAYAENKDEHEYEQMIEFLKSNKSPQFVEGKQIIEGLK